MTNELDAETGSVFDNIESDHIDALQELGNIGSGHSANALSELLSRRIDMSLPRLKIIASQDFSKVKWKKKDLNEKFAVIISETKEGNMPVSILIIFDQITIANLLTLMRTGERDINLNDLTSIDQSLLFEVGSILALHFHTAINNFLENNTKILPKVPILKIDKAEKILTLVTDHVKTIAKKLVLVECDIFTSDTKLSPLIILAPQEKMIANSIKFMFGEI